MRGNSLVFHFIILSTIIGVFSLGVWQLQRREWKHELVRQMDKNLILPATGLPQTMDKDFHWRQVEITPQIHPSKIIYVPRFRDGHWGYEIYVPVGENILRLGWTQQKLGEKPLPIGTVRAIVHPFDRAMNFIGTKLRGDEKPHADASLYADFNLATRDFYLDAVGELSPGIVSLWKKPELPDNHLQYAITWFALAGVLSALYLYKIHDERRKNP